jgi:zinc protease
LVEIFVSLREGGHAEAALEVLDRELARVRDEAITEAEIERARARFELGLLSGLDTVDGKASTLGFYDTVLGRPTVAFERLDGIRRIGASELRRVARKYFQDFNRSIVFVRPQAPDESMAEAGQ